MLIKNIFILLLVPCRWAAAKPINSEAQTKALADLLNSGLPTLTQDPVAAAKVSLVPGIHPQITLSNGDSLTGVVDVKGVESFKGIPYAEPPINQRRFKHPEAYKGSYDGLQAVKYAASCINVTPYGFFSLSRTAVENAVPHLNRFLMTTFFSPNINEDCLYLNVFRPNGTAATAKLPVIVWIHGGAFQFGSASAYPGDKFVVDSVAMGQPVIYVTLNYRLGPWGFLGGSAVKEEGSSNAGLHDQRLALKWVSDHIEAFGGDSNKITLMGESAGAISIAHHLVAYDGDNWYKGKRLFHGAIMQSGGPWSFGPITSAKSETLFRRFARYSGCSTQSNNETMECLRNKSVLDLQMAQNFNHEIKDILVTDPSDPVFGWSPRYDGDMITDNPAILAKLGKFAQVPYIIGTQEDEGTVLTLLFNLKTNIQVNSYMMNLLPNLSEDDLFKLIKMYPSDGRLKTIPGVKVNGRNKGIWRAINEIHPGYLRFARIIGDFMFEIPRLVLLKSTPRTVPHYVYRSEFLHNVMPVVGTPHAGELLWQFHLDMHPAPAYRRYFISFANNFDPNVNTGLPHWDAYSYQRKETMVIKLTKLMMGVDKTGKNKDLDFLVDDPKIIQM